MEVRPGDRYPKLTYDDMVKRALAQGYSKAGAEGIAQNFMRESGGNAGDTTGDHGTSRGLAQWHNSRKDELEAFAKAEGKSPSDPDVQFRFFDKDMREKYPTLRAQLIAETDPNKAEDAFKRIYERPASVMWGNTPGQLANDKYHYSDYAMREHEGRPNTKTVMMDPQEYLDLSPDLEGKPFTSPSGKALKKSVDSGEPIESIPTLDMRVHGNTGVVTDQDGRHRALMAQQSGLGAIPVAVRQTGEGQPTEIQGMSGNIVPADHPPVSSVPQSWWKKAVNSIIPSAQAAESDDDPFARFAPPPTKEQAAPQAAPKADPDDPFAQFAKGGQQGGQQQEPDGMLMSAVKGAAAGFGKTVLGGQELVGKGLEAVGATDTGKWLVDDARKGVANLDQETAADKKENPWSTGIGEFAGGMALPVGGTAGAIMKGVKPLTATLASGALQGALQPSGEDRYFWRDKLVGAGEGAAAALGGNALAHGIAGFVAPRLTNAARKLADMGIPLTPGQMIGGMLQRTENAMTSLPVVGNMIRNAEKKAVAAFNNSVLDRALADVGMKLPPGTEAGHEAIGVAQQMASAAYDRVLNGVQFQSTPNFLNGLQNLRQLVSEMPADKAAQFERIFENRLLRRLQPRGMMDGQTFKQVESELTNLENGFRRSPDMADKQIGTALREVKDLMREALEDSNPGKRAELEAANRTYAMLSRAEDASMKRSTEDGIFSPADLLRSIRDDAKRTGRRKMYARGDAMMQDLAKAGQAALPSKLSDSGTTERAMINGMLMGKLFEAPDLLAGFLGALPYTKTGLKAANRMAERPGPTRNAIAEFLRNAGPTLGNAASTGATERIEGH
jgi:hypothetical protein